MVIFLSKLESLLIVIKGTCLKQDVSNLLVAILGSCHQGCVAIGLCVIWVRLCLE